MLSTNTCSLNLAFLVTRATSLSIVKSFCFRRTYTLSFLLACPVQAVTSWCRKCDRIFGASNNALVVGEVPHLPSTRSRTTSGSSSKLLFTCPSIRSYSSILKYDCPANLSRGTHQ